MLPRVFSLLYIFFHSPLGAHTFTGLAQDHRHRPWFQCHSCHDAGDPGDLLEDSSDIEPFSRLTSIKACNIAGLGPSAGVTFSGGARLVAVTGGELRQGREQFIHRPTHSLTHPFVHLESGTGKSLLVSKVLGLATGSKFSSSMLSSAKPGVAELSAIIHEPHLSSLVTSLEIHGIDSSKILSVDEDGGCEIHLTRTLIPNKESGRTATSCSINGQNVSVKTLRELSAHLFTRVDVAVASQALGRPAARLTILDKGVSEHLLIDCASKRDDYKAAKRKRERIEGELKSRVLPQNIRGHKDDLDEDQVEMMRHWVDELDSFELRVSTFVQNTVAQFTEMGGADGELGVSLKMLRDASWLSDQAETNEDFSLFNCILNLRDGLKTTQSQLESSQTAYESLASVRDFSAQIALENTRKILYDVCADDKGQLFEAIERAHELLNAAEIAINECARSIDGDLMPILEKRAHTGVNMDALEGLIGDWNGLSRKHGITSELLPKCHKTLQEELDGDIEALNQLPQAKEDERQAREAYSNSCAELSDARLAVSESLSEKVSQLLPSLGLDGSTFEVTLMHRSGGFADPYTGPESLGVDTADFVLLHRNVPGRSDGTSQAKGGNVEKVGSSGEKSRLLLAMESVLPGSIGTICSNVGALDGGTRSDPICVVYDEIDAHVGGRAATTMTELLREQRLSSQIIAITHAASLAAKADQHIVVERWSDGEVGPVTRAYPVEGHDRRREVARMAAGNLVPNEAEKFADALIKGI